MKEFTDTYINYALILKTELENIPRFKEELMAVMERHGVRPVYQKIHTGHLRVVMDDGKD